MSEQMKLSPSQQRVVDRMREGWELGISNSISAPNAWLQRDGLGRGGPTEKVSRGTVDALRKRGIITTGRFSFPTQRYTLSPTGGG